MTKTPSPAPKAKKSPAQADDGADRIAKVIARAGLCSRRDAEAWIEARRVAVDGIVLSSPALRVRPGQRITVDGRPLPAPEATRLFRYHKPKGVVTSARDPEGRATIYDTLPEELPRLMPVGRLDISSEGLLLLTNDGELTERMLHPSREVEKVYLARVSNQVTPEEAKRIERGVMLDGRPTSRAKARILSVMPLYTDMMITIHEGRNRQVRKMVEAIGHEVVMLRRVRFGPLKLNDLPRGMWRALTPDEIDALKRL